MDGYRKMNAAIAKVEKEELERDEVDRMLFGQRLKSVMAKSKRASSSGGSAKGSGQVARSLVDTVVKKEDEGSDSQDNPSNFSSILMDDKISQSAGKRNPVHVKVEPVDNNMIETTVKNEMGNLSNSSMVRVKSGGGIIYEFTEDELDNMLLSERMKLYSEKMAPSFKIGRVVECSSETAPSVFDCTPISAASAKPLKVCPPRKQRKTATDSVQAAMEEDAPGLLRVLIENGVSVDEMKLYGKNESNEPLDGLSFEDNFSELRAVISKLFSSQRQSLLKLASLQSTKGEKASYCLACLFSLIEQARYLQFRKWPVEWGWCRDLQSFIFVFERHNRIVLERPEYGYATYFFELMDSSPIDWQIRRLVIAMKLTSYSRVTLIENKKLTVGKDLSEGEAKVLTSYGWIPNTGLGTMLKYCDRVIHDRISEKDGSEWKSKIEKLLVAGYSGGSIVENPMDHNVAQDFPEIKLELE